MNIYTSRYANPVLRSGNYTTVRISVGTPKWNLGYTLDGEINELMPFGLFNKYDEYEDFKSAYFRRLDNFGVDRIFRKLGEYQSLGKDVVLLCYEDIRGDTWCHRTAFAEWWLMNTGEIIEELKDTSTPPPKRTMYATTNHIGETEPDSQPTYSQLSLFSI